MPTFHILYFQESVLELAEEVGARDVLEAVQSTAGKPAHLRVDTWSEHRKIATTGASPIDPNVAPPRKRK